MPSFFEQPILNSPYERPRRHWELDEGRPTHRIVENRREASFITPIPKPRRLPRGQRQLALDEAAAEIDTANQQYQHAHVINGVRQQVAAWRELPERQWKVTPETARLLRHWRHHPFAGIRPFFCQVEAAETAIWLMEVAPKLGRQARSFLEHLQAANDGANPGLTDEHYLPRQLPHEVGSAVYHAGLSALGTKLPVDRCATAPLEVVPGGQSPMAHATATRRGP